MTKDIYSMVTDRILAELEKGEIPWKKPWVSPKNGAHNRITGRPYSLLNRMMLIHNGEYATFDQWKSLGGHVREGEHSEKVVFWKKLEPAEVSSADPAFDGAKNDRPKFVLRYYNVFHVSQIDGVEPLPSEASEEVTKPQRIKSAEKLAKEYFQRESVLFEEETSDKAYYSPTIDAVHVPSIKQYRHPEEYYSTIFHEITHSTGHVNRLNRPGLVSPRFGSEEYSKEELIAEISSASILATLGLDNDETLRNSAAYVLNWLKALKEDKCMFVLAASAAERAARFILSEPADA